MTRRSERGTMTRRRFVITGTGALALLASVIYAPLLVGDRFERFFASKLGIGEELATELLARARREYGDLEYDGRAATFALAFRGPLGLLVPGAVKRKAAAAMLDPGFAPAAASFAYSEDEIAPIVAACSGLIRVA